MGMAFADERGIMPVIPSIASGEEICYTYN